MTCEPDFSFATTSLDEVFEAVGWDFDLAGMCISPLNTGRNRLCQTVGAGPSRHNLAT